MHACDMQIVRLACRQRLATELADGVTRHLVSLLHVTVQQNAGAEHAGTQPTCVCALAVRVTHVARHLPAQTVGVGAQLAAVDVRPAMTVHVTREVLDAATHEAAVGAGEGPCRGHSRTPQLHTQAGRLHPATAVHPRVVTLQVGGASAADMAEVTGEQVKTLNWKQRSEVNRSR